MTNHQQDGGGSSSPVGGETLPRSQSPSQSQSQSPSSPTTVDGYAPFQYGSINDDNRVVTTADWMHSLGKFVPIVKWLPRYRWRHDLLFDVVAGITVAMMLIPQEVSLASIMHVPPQHGLYTAATAPFVYALLGSSTVLSVASGSEVSLLVGSALHHIKTDDERVATGILICFLSGVLLLLIRVLGLSSLADFFSRPVMGGFLSAGGFLIMLSQVPNWLGIKLDHAEYPPQQVYKIANHLDKIQWSSFWLGLGSIVFLGSLRLIKSKFFSQVGLNSLFGGSDDTLQDDPRARAGTLSCPATDQIPSPMVTPSHVHHHVPLHSTTSRTNVSNRYVHRSHGNGHGFSLSDEQFLSMESHQLHEEPEASKLPTTTRDLPLLPPSTPQKVTKTRALLLFGARTLCDLGPLIVCVLGGIVGYSLGPKQIKLTGNVPRGFPSPVVPWYGISQDLIQDNFANILVNALTITAVVYLSSIAMAKRLAIKRNEQIVVSQELTGLGVASLVVSIFQGMPPTGGMSRTAVNLQNARTQLASMITVAVIITSLYTLTSTLSYLPKATLASIIIVAGYSLVEYSEAKWLYQVKRDEFYVWLASFVLTLLLGVTYGLAASILSSLVAVMIKTKKPTVAVLGHLPTDPYTLVDRSVYPEAACNLDGIVALRVEGSLYFANCEYVTRLIEREIETRQHERVECVVLDSCLLHDWDATTVQVIMDLQETLQSRKIRFAIANARGHLRNMILNTPLLAKRLVGNDPSMTLDQVVQMVRHEQQQQHLPNQFLASIQVAKDASPRASPT